MGKTGEIFPAPRKPGHASPFCEWSILGDEGLFFPSKPWDDLGQNLIDNAYHLR
jgi:hypothetical protein